MTSRHRNFCFTSFVLELPTFEEINCSYIIWGEEVCPTTGRDHLQGYIEFKQGVTFNTVKRRLGNPAAHVTVRKGTQLQAVDYCKKDGAFHEFGEAAAQGKRSDLDAVRAGLSAGHGMRRIIRDGASYVGLRYAEKRLTYLEAPRADAVPDVLWYWGGTGTGKTRAALAEATEGDDDDVWWTNGGVKWFDGMLQAHSVGG